MARINKTAVGSKPKLTFEGAVAANINAEKELRRTVMACLLWEDNFYESGVSVAARIAELVRKVEPRKVLEIARQARNEQHLRHVGLQLVAQLERQFKLHAAKPLVADTLFDIVQRPDELTEFLAMYWADKQPNGKHTPPLTAQAKKGLARAFAKFDAYRLAKYNNADRAYKLKDVFRLVHPSTTNAEQWATWQKLLAGTLESPDTWEVALSAGANKKETFERLIRERKLGAMALLRNLRGMEQAGVNEKLIREAILNANADKVLPFRFVTAARYAPKFEQELEQLMFKCLAEMPKLTGKTIFLVDVSGSMSGKLSEKSELNRLDGAAALAMLLREVCQTVEVYRFDDRCELVPPRRGFALREAIGHPRGGTYTENAIQVAAKSGYDRIIVFTDEQSHQTISAPMTNKAYFVNVATYKNGIGYGKWFHVDGFSESIVNYIIEAENSNLF